MEIKSRMARAGLIKVLIDLCRIKFFNKGLKFIKIAKGDFVSLDQYLTLYPTAVNMLCQKNVRLYYAPPQFFAPVEQSANLLAGQEYNQYAVCIKNASLIGNSNLIILPGYSVLYDLRIQDKKSRCRYSDSGVLLIREESLLYKWSEIQGNFDDAIWMGGNFSWNYYHFVYEFLIKFQALELLKIDLQVPVLIDQFCLQIPQFSALINMVNSQNRKIIGVRKGAYFSIKNLYYINCPNFIPPDFIDERDIRSEDVQFDIPSLKCLQLRLIKFASKKVFPKRIFISRKNASIRRAFNEEAVFGILKQFGFVMLTPETLSIEDQIGLFNQAEFIMGGSGAAFTNLLFCRRKCEAIIFVKYKWQYSGFSTIAQAIGVNLQYFSEIVDNGNELESLHEPFTIDINKLEHLVNKIFKFK